MLVSQEKLKNREIQNMILKIIADKTECAFGTLVMELNVPYQKVLKNVLELKNMGKITKSEDHMGYYRLAMI